MCEYFEYVNISNSIINLGLVTSSLEQRHNKKKCCTTEFTEHITMCRER